MIEFYREYTSVYEYSRINPSSEVNSGLHPSTIRQRFLGLPAKGSCKPDDITREWYGIVDKGWLDGMKVFQETLEQFPTSDLRFPGYRRKVVRADQGDELDVHSLYRGQCDTMWRSARRMKARSRRPPDVRLVMNQSYSFGHHSSHLMWSSAAVYVLADILTRLGGNVAIDYVNCGVGTYVDMPCRERQLVVPIKSFGQPLSVSNLVLTSHACFLRWAGLHHCLEHSRRSRKDFGYPCSYYDMQENRYADNHARDKIIVMDQLESQSEALKAVENALRDLEVRK